jgi:hypothetical protein
MNLRISTVPLRAVKVQSFTDTTAAALATAVNAWIAANSGQRTMVSLVFDAVSTSSYTAFLTYTE